jgi:hypothetical protein
MNRRLLAFPAMVMVLGATLQASPSAARSTPGYCSPRGSIRVASLPSKVSLDACDLVGRAIVDHGVKAIVPEPGKGVYVESIGLGGIQELGIRTSPDGVVSFTGVGSEQMAASTLGPNDALGSATNIASVPYSDVGTNAGASIELDEPSSNCTSPQATVWYSFTAPSSGTFTASVTPPDGSSLDPILAVWSVNPLTEVGCVDSTFDGEGETIEFEALADTTYLFQVDDYYGEGGEFTFRLDQLVPPPNDSVAGATTIASIPYSIEGTNVNASVEPAEAGSDCRDPARTVWYSYTASESNALRATVTPQGDMDPTLALWSASGPTDLECADNSYIGESEVITFSAVAGQTYLFSIDDSYGGTFTFTLASTAPPPNDSFAGAVVVPGVPYSDTVAAIDAFKDLEPGETASSPCPAAATLWYAFSPPTAMVLTADMAAGGDDSSLSVYRGNSLAGLSRIGCGTSGTPVKFKAYPGTNYYFQVGIRGYDYPAGNLTFNLAGTDLPPPPGNDQFATAVGVGTLPMSNNVATAGSTLQPTEPNPGCGPMEGSAWYRFRPKKTDWFSAKVKPANSGSFGITLAVYRGSSLGSLAKIGCNAKRVTFRARAGATYYLQVGPRSISGNLINVGLVRSMDPNEVCQNCPAPCHDPARGHIGFKAKAPLGWYFKRSSVPSYLGKAAVLRAIKRGFGNITNSRNDCGMRDQVGASAPYRGVTSRAATACSAYARDGKNVVDFGPLGFAAGQACYSFVYTPGRWTLTEVDVRFATDSFAWTLKPDAPGCTNRLDLESVATHEAGHAFGLDHVYGNHENATMYGNPSMGPNCGSSFRTLAEGEVLALRSLY